MGGAPDMGTEGANAGVHLAELIFDSVPQNGRGTGARKFRWRWEARLGWKARRHWRYVRPRSFLITDSEWKGLLSSTICSNGYPLWRKVLDMNTFTLPRGCAIRMKTITSRIVVLLYSSLFSLTAFANCPVPEIKANSEFFKRDVVFTGSVLSQSYKDGKGESGWYYRVRVTKVLKGPIRREFTVYTEDASNRLPLEEGREYLLFADQRNGRLEIDNCGNSALLSDASQSLQQIKRIATAKDAEIVGWLAPETNGVDLSGIHVVIRGGERTYRAVTDKDGRFRISVPFGTYKVDFGNHEYYQNGADVFWYEPEHFSLHAGETAALQFVSVRHPEK
jgi:hypothetical protein